MSALSKQFEFIINTGTFTATSVAIPSAAIAPDGSSLFKSLPQQGDGYYGASDGLHTVSYTVTPNFVGTLTTQATLATTPIESDWFTVTDTTVEFTQLVNPVASTTTNYFNFTGNFVWCRVVMQRADLPINGSLLFANFNH